MCRERVAEVKACRWVGTQASGRVSSDLTGQMRSYLVVLLDVDPLGPFHLFLFKE